MPNCQKQRLSFEETSKPLDGKLTTLDPFHSEGAGFIWTNIPIYSRLEFALSVFRASASTFSGDFFEMFEAAYGQAGVGTMENVYFLTCTYGLRICCSPKGDTIICLIFLSWVGTFRKKRHGP